MKKRIFHTKNKSISRTVLVGTSVSVLSFLLISLISSFVLSLVPDPLSAVGIASIGALVLSGAISSFFTVKYKGEGGFICSMICAAVCILIIIAVSLIASKGAIGGRGIMNIVSYAAISLLFSYLGTKTGNKRFRPHR